VVDNIVQLGRTLSNWRFSVPFLVNQSGSLLYFWLLGSAEISMAVPICNALTFIFTALAARLMGAYPSRNCHADLSRTLNVPSCCDAGEEQRLTLRVVLGTAVIALGVAICVSEKLV
jgi:hypothetical protein